MAALPDFDGCRLKPIVMFEGKLPLASGISGEKRGESAPEELCSIEWTELVARLAAARDLRRELGQGDEDALASFDAHCARQISGSHDNAPEESKRGVNPEDLGNGKEPRPISGRHAEGVDTANRGNT